MRYVVAVILLSIVTAAVIEHIVLSFNEWRRAQIIDEKLLKYSAGVDFNRYRNRTQ